MVQTNQEARHASFRTISGTSTDYNGDSFAAFLAEGATETGSYNGAFIEWLQIRTTSSDDNLDNLKALFASQLGVGTWDEVGTFPANFSPTDITGLLLWLDGADTSAGNIVQSGGLVSQWSDKSGLNNHALQGTEANQPITGTRTIGGENVLDFDGSAAELQLTSKISHSAGISAFIVAERDANGTNTLLAGQDSGDIQMRVDSPTGAPELVKRSVSVLITGGSTIAVDVPTAYGYTMMNSVGVEVFVDGTTDGDDGTNPAFTGGLDFVGSAGGVSGLFDGNIAEVLVYSAILSSGDITSISDYLSTKWSI